MTKKTVALEAIKALREKTSASLGDVRRALEAASGDEAKALQWLREHGAQIAEARQDRSTGQGRVEAYVHHDGRMASLVEVNCETDFVARTEEFVQFCRDLAMHVAAMQPRSVAKEDGAASGLLGQPFVKDPSVTIQDLLQGLVAKTGERVVIKRFVRMGVGESA